MNNLNQSEIKLDAQSQLINTEHELDETALELVNGGGFWESAGELVGEIVAAPFEAARDFSRGFSNGVVPD